MNTPTLGQLLHSYFEDYLKCQKGLRLTSVRSYRDGLSLLLQSVAKQSGHKLSALTITDLTCERVITFLNGLEAERHNHIRTRNQPQKRVPAVDRPIHGTRCRFHQKLVLCGVRSF